MRYVRYIIWIVAITFACVVALGWLSLPKASDGDVCGFSSADAIETIGVISKKQHSVAHEVERTEVRNYLISRLEAIADTTPTIYSYPNQEVRGYTFDAVDILAEFPPVNPMSDTTFVMLVAHYDSRYAQPFRSGTVWSYGAADDGYGVGIILESVETLLHRRGEWKQGIKVLYTDAEEVGMVGMKNIYRNNPEVFENVGLVINVEARGPYGSALLFETSEGNSKLIDLYSANSRYPVSYSLTNLVYSILPNFTDFTVVRDSIPGFNFATVEDINHYHTHFDNFSNLSADAIQHYAVQIMPLLNEYLTNDVYADRDYLKSNDSYTYFSMPLIGIVKFSKSSYAIASVLLFVMFAIMLFIELRKGAFKIKQFFMWSLNIFLFSLVAFALGELIAFISALVSGVQFKFMGVVQGVYGDNLIMLISIIVMILITISTYFIIQKLNFKIYDKLLLYSGLAVLAILNLAMALALGESFMFFIPLALTIFAVLMLQLFRCKFMLPMAVAVIVMQSLSFYYLLSMALTIGALGAVMFFVFNTVPVLIAMSQIYLRKEVKPQR